MMNQQTAGQVLGVLKTAACEVQDAHERLSATIESLEGVEQQQIGVAHIVDERAQLLYDDAIFSDEKPPQFVLYGAPDGEFPVIAHMRGETLLGVYIDLVAAIQAEEE
ncbi:MAG TPA: hypothetical protein VFV52_07255 [Bacilli bacterium]|nr:hypothetical protein [Bacilli bacterium]